MSEAEHREYTPFHQAVRPPVRSASGGLKPALASWPSSHLQLSGFMASDRDGGDAGSLEARSSPPRQSIERHRRRSSPGRWSAVGARRPNGAWPGPGQLAAPGRVDARHRPADRDHQDPQANGSLPGWRRTHGRSARRSFPASSPRWPGSSMQFAAPARLRASVHLPGLCSPVPPAVNLNEFPRNCRARTAGGAWHSPPALHGRQRGSPTVGFD